MNKIVKISFIMIVGVSLIACGSGAKDEKGELGDLKVKLEKLKKDRSGLETQIRQIEEKIAKIDPTAAQQTQKLVSAAPAEIKDFVHYIEIQANVDADNIAYVSPPGQPGVVKAIYVQNGSRVSRGQTLLKLDDAMARPAVNAARQQVEQIKARLAQAQTIYERRQNLWKQNIGTEIDVINARTDVEATQSSLRAAEAGLASAQEALNKTNVTAEISGVVERVNVRVGETFTGFVGNDPQIILVNSSSLKIEAEVPENYIPRVKKGDSVLAVVSETGKTYRTALSVVGSAIDPSKRSFLAEAKLPSDPLLKPNQLASMRIQDYKAKNAVVVPTNVVQSDEKGKYVYIIEKSGDKQVARKKTVIVGESYQGSTEIKSGLTGNEQIITEGYQTVYDGQSVATGK